MPEPSRAWANTLPAPAQNEIVWAAQKLGVDWQQVAEWAYMGYSPKQWEQLVSIPKQIQRLQVAGQPVPSTLTTQLSPDYQWKYGQGITSPSAELGGMAPGTVFTPGAPNLTLGAQQTKTGIPGTETNGEPEPGGDKIPLPGGGTFEPLPLPPVRFDPQGNVIVDQAALDRVERDKLNNKLLDAAIARAAADANYAQVVALEAIKDRYNQADEVRKLSAEASIRVLAQAFTQAENEAERTGLMNRLQAQLGVTKVISGAEITSREKISTAGLAAQEALNRANILAQQAAQGEQFKFQAALSQQQIAAAQLADFQRAQYAQQAAQQQAQYQGALQTATQTWQGLMQAQQLAFTAVESEKNRALDNRRLALEELNVGEAVRHNLSVERLQARGQDIQVKMDAYNTAIQMMENPMTFALYRQAGNLFASLHPDLAGLDRLPVPTELTEQNLTRWQAGSQFAKVMTGAQGAPTGLAPFEPTGRVSTPAGAAAPFSPTAVGAVGGVAPTFGAQPGGVPPGVAPSGATLTPPTLTPQQVLAQLQTQQLQPGAAPQLVSTGGARQAFVPANTVSVTNYPGPFSPVAPAGLTTPLTPEQVIAISGQTVPRQGQYAGVPSTALVFAPPKKKPAPPVDLGFDPSALSGIF